MEKISIKLLFCYFITLVLILTPIWDPRWGRQNVRCDCLVQTIDLAPTILEFFNIERPVDMQGKPLSETISQNKPIREAALFGLHGAQVNCTDGRYVYMRSPVDSSNKPLYNYTLMPTHMRGFFRMDELLGAELSEPFSFTKGCRVLKTPAKSTVNNILKTALYDLENDPAQDNPIENPDIEEWMIKKMVSLMKQNDAPKEQYERLGLQGYT